MRFHLLTVRGILAIGACLLWSASASFAAQSTSRPATRLLWGDTHLHTAHSVDAYSTGNYFSDPNMAFRYAKGLPVLHPVTREKVTISRPLDFLVVADHAEMLGLQVGLDAGMEEMLATASGRRLLDLHRGNRRAAFGEVSRINVGEGKDLLRDLHTDAVRGTAWRKQVVAADQNNEPGRFTALIGWEWSAMPNWNNLHRVVMTTADSATASRFIPFSSYESDKPEALWRWLEKTSAEVGARFLAIPHNSNMSNGIMFDRTDSEGKPLTADYARQRMRWEPVTEITQVKGTSETDPSLSPNDEFAGFEVRNKLLTGPPAKAAKGSFTRSAQLEGLSLENTLGANPFKFGVIGSSDSHTGLVDVEEGAFRGKLGNQMVTEVRPNDRSNFPIWELSASGLAAVWAADNTRESIFTAFERKEVYATSGPRIALRLFAGYGFVSADARAQDIAAVGYRRGVPMGGNLKSATQGQAPSFLVQALKDPRSANLDRVQMVKAWVDRQGQQHERVFDIAWSDARKKDANGKLPAVGNTVDAKTATWSDRIGAASLVAAWRDPEFDPQVRALYYARVLEIPTPRHSTYDAVALGIDVSRTGAPVWIQERAWSSPVWYTP